MVFKGRFFSSKKSDTSSPDGSSNIPRSVGSNSDSPIRSDKKKPKSASPSIAKESPPSRSFLKKKEPAKANESLKSSKPSSGVATNPSAASKLKASEEAAPNSVSVSPIVASSLGLNKIKTRSGPLPQESFFSFASKEKGSALGASNLSRPLAGAGIGGKDDASSSKKKKEKSFTGNSENRCNLDSMSTESVASRDQNSHLFQSPSRSRLQNSDSSSAGPAGF